MSSAAELRKVAKVTAGGDALAYVVEACTACRWHHLLRVLPV